MMLLHLLLHVLIFQLLHAKGGQKDAAKEIAQQPLPPPKDMNYEIKPMKDCDNTGLYFVTEYNSEQKESIKCYLCYCHSRDTAICWKRESKRCHKDTVHHGLGPRDTRIRRSPGPGFSDIFFRDASRDVFRKNSDDKQCKPYESSFSDDCPPADWCIGCTVCDCDSNGRWDCHILSFCSDPKKIKTNGRKMVKKKPTTTPWPYAAQARTGPPIMRLGHHNKKHNPKPQKKVVKKSIPPSHTKQKQQKKKPPIRYKRIASKPNISHNKLKKRNLATQKPVHIYKKNRKHANGPNHIPHTEKKNKKHTDNKNDIPVDVAQQIVKQMMSVVQKLVKKEIYNMTRLVQDMQQESAMRGSGRTTYRPRIIGGTMRARRKREIEKVTTEGPQLKILHGEYKRPLSSKEATYLTSTVSSSTKDKHVNFTALKNESNSLSPNTEPIIVIPTSTTTDPENNYYKYIVATNIRPLSNNNTLDVMTPSTTTVFKTNVTNATEKTKENIEITVTTKTEKYSVNVPKSMTKNRLINLPDLNNTQVNNRNLSETSNNTVINTTQAASRVTVENMLLDNINNTYNYIAKVDPTGSDIKFNYWPHVQNFRDKKIKLLTKSTKYTKAKVNKTGVIIGDKYKVRGKDVSRITVTKKYNLLKTLNYHRCPFLNRIALNTNDTHNLASNNKISYKKNTLTNLLSELNNKKEPRRKLRKFSFMKYLTTIFNRIFKRKKNSDRFSRYHILETLCENFGPCRIKSKDKYILKEKLADLDNATMAILKTVKIIKGLLTLLDDSVEKNKSLSKQGSLGSDIQKLNSILKGQYGNSLKEPLTETKITQIEYIKKNTQDFVKSVSKFAISLNQILEIVSKKDVNDSEINTKQQVTVKDSFQSLRDLIVKYNLVQNTFMKKMYDLVNSFENKVHDKPKVSAAQDMNSTIAIENFSRHILKNLRKLKDLAQTLNYNGRTKREIKDDDTIEYLLMLMEYLLKQNHPLDAAPANDGIDLLIEAIKNAPDIKTVRKKVLVNMPSSGIDTTVMAISRNLLYRSTTESSIVDDESESDTGSNEDSEKSKGDTSEDTSKTKLEETKDLFDIAEEEKDGDERIPLDRRAENVPSSSDSNTKAPFYEETDANIIPHPLNEFEPTVSPQLLKEEESIDNSSIYYASGNENGYTDNPGNANKNYFDITESANVFSNTVNNNYGSNTAYGNNNYDINSADGNINIANMADSNSPSFHAGDGDTYNAALDLKNNSIETTHESVNIAKEENSDIVVAEEALKGEEDSVKKTETVYTGEIDEDETTSVTISVVETEIAATVSPENVYPKKKQKHKEIITLDSYDNEKINDKKSKLEWIEENFRRENSNYDGDKAKAKEEKREDTKTHTTVAAPSRTSAPELNKKRVADVSLISNEVETGGKKKKPTINTQEVMFKKHMDLLNSLDYVTEKAEFENDNESKDGNIEERYSENYFV